MKDATKVWDKQLEDALDQMVSVFRKAVITDAEAFAKFRGQKEVTAQGLEVALYKSIMTLNETNKAIMFKRMGPVEAMSMIRTLEDRAVEDVSITILEDLEANYENLPPEVKEIVKLIRSRLKGGNKEP